MQQLVSQSILTSAVKNVAFVQKTGKELLGSFIASAETFLL